MSGNEIRLGHAKFIFLAQSLGCGDSPRSRPRISVVRVEHEHAGVREWRSDADLRPGGSSFHCSVCQSLVVWRNSQLPVSFLWTQNQRGEIILQSGRCLLFPPGWKCEGCHWLQTLQETPGSTGSFKSGAALSLTHLLGHKLFFGCSNFRDFPSRVNKPFRGGITSTRLIVTCIV